MKVISPFGTKIAKLKFSSKLIKIINLEIDKIVSKKKLIKKFDYSDKLVGQVKQELQLPRAFIKKNLEKIIYNDVKKYINNKIIGLTCHNSKKLAYFAVKNKVSYIALGSFYKSKLKPNAKKANPKILKWAKKNIKMPIVAIGGINDKNYKKLILAGANFIAISSFIWDNPLLKPELAIRKFK